MGGIVCFMIVPSINTSYSGREHCLNPRGIHTTVETHVACQDTSDLTHYDSVKSAMQMCNVSMQGKVGDLVAGYSCPYA